MRVSKNRDTLEHLEESDVNFMAPPVRSLHTSFGEISCSVYIPCACFHGHLDMFVAWEFFQWQVLKSIT